MKKSVLSLTAAIFGTSLAAHAATTIYSQPFPSGSTILPMNTTGVEWNAKLNGSTYDPANTTPTSGPVIGVDTTNRYLFNSGGVSDKGRHLWWATENVFPATNYDLLTTIDFGLAANSGSQVIQVAIRSGGSWFVSQSGYSHTGTSGGAASFGAKQLDFTTATWNALNFDTLAVGAAGDPTAGSVTNIGFFSVEILGHLRIDNIEVAAIPEPGVWWLALGGAGLLLRRRRNG